MIETKQIDDAVAFLIKTGGPHAAEVILAFKQSQAFSTFCETMVGVFDRNSPTHPLQKLADTFAIWSTCIELGIELGKQIAVQEALDQLQRWEGTK